MFSVRIEHGRHEYLLVSCAGHSMTADPEYSEVSHWEAGKVIEWFISRSPAGASDVCSVLYEGRRHDDSRHDARTLLGEVMRALRPRGGLMLLRRPRQVRAYSHVRHEPVMAPEPDTGPEELVEQVWIALRLVDRAGEPIANERYELVLPNGQIRSGTFDSAGSVYLEGIPAGACKLRMPDLHPDEWSLA